MYPRNDFAAFKFNYVALAFGFGVLVLGTFFLFICRNYVYDYTNKDLFLPFGILLIIIAIILMIAFGVRIGRDWIKSTDFTKLNEAVLLRDEPEQQDTQPQSPQHSLMTGAYSVFNTQSPI
ncbi:conserved hypothetical protein [Echinococcus multilocularis]|uniref:Uncharacterized protein n=1 Tax=Echinococcus multilocularis TaxID=6211 RepID=A0A068Y3M6_ECHMU|nr:conserved hypothetical protein [Echinococcus multilocularis]